MAEHDQNNLSFQNESPAEEPDDDFIPKDAWPVCPKCLQPCHPLQNYCSNCDSNEVINPLASYMPFVRIRFVYGIFGKMWRRIWYEKNVSITSRLLCLLMIIMFAPVFLVLGLPFLLTDKIRNPLLKNTAVIILYIIEFILVMFFISWSKF